MVGYELTLALGKQPLFVRSGSRDRTKEVNSVSSLPGRSLVRRLGCLCGKIAVSTSIKLETNFQPGSPVSFRGGVENRPTATGHSILGILLVGEVIDAEKGLDVFPLIGDL